MIPDFLQQEICNPLSKVLLELMARGYIAPACQRSLLSDSRIKFFSWTLLERCPLVRALVIAQLFGECKMLIRLSSAAQNLISLGEEIVDVVVLRIQFDGALEHSGSRRRIIALQRDLTQQDVGARRSLVEPDCLFQYFLGFLVFLKPHISVPEAPVNQPNAWVDCHLFVEFVDGGRGISLVKIDLA